MLPGQEKKKQEEKERLSEDQDGKKISFKKEKLAKLKVGIPSF